MPIAPDPYMIWPVTYAANKYPFHRFNYYISFAAVCISFVGITKSSLWTLNEFIETICKILWKTQLIIPMQKLIKHCCGFWDKQYVITKSNECKHCIETTIWIYK